MRTDNIKVIGTVDLTPTWEQATRICLMAIKHADDEVACNDAEGEIMKLARGYDELIKDYATLVEKLKTMNESVTDED